MIEDFAVDDAITQRLDGERFLNLWKNIVYPVNDLHFGGTRMMILVGCKFSWVKTVGLAHVRQIDD